VMDVQVVPGTTYLTSPAIAPQYLFSELVKLSRIKLESRLLG
jgi:hypothetical protein